MKKILVIIDMQNDFVTGPLGSEQAQKILPLILEYAKTFAGKILFTKDTHGSDYLNGREGKKLPVPHCIQCTPGWELALPLDSFQKETGSPVFCKPTFGSIQLAQALYAENEKDPIQEIQLVGVCTDICVISNALTLRSFLPETPIAVVASLCAGTSPQGHQNALDAMAGCQIDIL
ncbi:MAG: cysteine hydrolase [Oscillospiraceae bacterium]|nr:cysteine hydrolase [Oscillospiraceae bacterium]